jgi:hypothetical protein
MTTEKTVQVKRAESAIFDLFSNGGELPPSAVMESVLGFDATSEFSANDVRDALWHLIGSGRIVLTPSRTVRRAEHLAVPA